MRQQPIDPFKRATLLGALILFGQASGFGRAATSRGGTAIPPGYPDEHVAGVPKETELKPYDGPTTIMDSGTTIEGFLIKGTLTIHENASNVTVRNCKIVGGYWFGIQGSQAKHLRIERCTIIGSGENGNAGIGGNGVFVGNDISRYENGIFSAGGSDIVIEGNYIHDLENRGKDPHYDGIQVMGGENNISIIGNTIIARGNSDIFINSQWAPIDGVIIQRNYLSSDGPLGFNIYVVSDDKGGLVTNASVQHNRFVPGNYGFLNTYRTAPSLLDNLNLITGLGVGDVQ